MEQEQIKRIVDALLHDNPILQSMQLRAQIIGHDPNAIHSLAGSIQQSSRRAYGNLTDDMLLQIIQEIQEKFGDVANITLDDWANEEVLRRLVDLHEYVRERLAMLLHKEKRQIGWGIVGKIINSVFGGIPVITPSVRKVLHQLNFLQYLNTDNIQVLLKAVGAFCNRHREEFIAIAADLIAHGVVELGVGASPKEQALVFAPILLTGIFRIIWSEIRYWRDGNQEHRN